VKRSRRADKAAPPRITQDATIVDLQLITRADLIDLAEAAGLSILGSAVLGDVADRVNFALEGYAAGHRRDRSRATATEHQKRATDLAAASRLLMDRLGVGSSDPSASASDATARGRCDPRRATWHVTAALIEPLCSTPETVAELLPLAREVDAALTASAARAGSMRLDGPKDLELLLQRVLYPLAPALALMERLGRIAERHHAARISRGGRAPHTARRFLFTALARAFRTLFGRPPAPPTPGGVIGQARGRGNADLDWFKALMRLVEGRAKQRLQEQVHAAPEAAAQAPEVAEAAEALRSLAALAAAARDEEKKVEPLYEKLATWVAEGAVEAGRGFQTA
jgi:hypothetical protein